MMTSSLAFQGVGLMVLGAAMIGTVTLDATRNRRDTVEFAVTANRTARLLTLSDLVHDANEYCRRRADILAAMDVAPGRPDIPLLVGAFLPSIPSTRIGGNHDVGVLSHSLWPAVALALKDIEEHDCLLHGWALNLNASDTAEKGKCSAAVGTRRFFDIMNKVPRRVALFGDACEQVNMPIAMAAKYWHILQLSYAETHPKFSGSDSGQLYPTFYLIVPGSRSLHLARLRLLAHYNWTRIATIKQIDATHFALPHETFVQLMEKQHPHHDAAILTAEISAENWNMTSTLTELKKRDARIFVADVEPSFAARLLCQAMLANMTHADEYVWILPGNQNNFWWLNVNTTEFDDLCDTDTLTRALEGHFRIEFARLRPDRQTRTISGKTTEEYERAYWASCSGVHCDAQNAFHGYVYDGVWALATVLDSAVVRWHQKYNETFDPLKMRSNEEWVRFERILIDVMNRTSFAGVTGLVSFSENQRNGIVEISQFRDARYVTVGYYDADRDEFWLTDLWTNEIDYNPPRDETLRVYVTEFVHRGLYVFMSALAAFGMFIAVVFLGINVYFRNHCFIRMSSANLNNLIIVGSLLVFASVPLLGVDTRDQSDQYFEALCYAKVWVLCFGFTLAFGSMFSKTWRVHSIFTNIKLNKKAIKDYQLFIIVAFLLLLDVCVLGSWMLASPVTRNVTVLTDLIYTDGERNVIPQVEECSSSYAVVFQVVVYIEKGLLMMLGCFLAWETRRVNVPALNDSKYIGMCVYVVVLVSALGVSLSIVLSDQVTSRFALTAGFIIFCTTLTLCLVFVPKIIQLIKDPIGDQKNYRKGMLKQSNHAATFESESSGEGNEDNAEYAEVEQSRDQLENKINDKNHEIDQLISTLKELGVFNFACEDKGDSAFESSATEELLTASANRPSSEAGTFAIADPSTTPLIQRSPAPSVEFSNVIVTTRHQDSNIPHTCGPLGASAPVSQRNSLKAAAPPSLGRAASAHTKSMRPQISAGNMPYELLKSELNESEDDVSGEDTAVYRFMTLPDGPGSGGPVSPRTPTIVPHVRLVGEFVAWV